MTTTPQNAIKVANTFIERYGERGEIDHLKLQKLLYFAYGWWLALLPRQPALINVRPQVWKLGPVFQPVYNAFASYRGESIHEREPIEPFGGPESIASANDDKQSRIIDWIWGRYGHFDGISLSDMTHEPGTPWYTIAEKHDFKVPRYLEIPDEENRAYFTRLAKKEGIAPAIGPVVT